MHCAEFTAEGTALSGGEIAAIVIGVLVLLVAVAVTVATVIIW